MSTKKPSIWKRKNFSVVGLVFLLIILSVFLIIPFLRSGYFSTHDGEWTVVRLGAMHRAILSGHFPVRWAGNLNFSYGYPLFLFTYPLPYYLGEIFNLLGFGLVGSVKLLFIISVIFSGLTMFFLGKEIFGPETSGLAGLISAIFYLYAPYRLVNLYVRGSLGESLAFVLYPLLFLSLLKYKKNPHLWLPLGAIFYGILLLTHNISALLITPFLLVFALVFVKRRSLLIFILGGGLAFFFLFPALAEKNNIILSQIPLADQSQHLVRFSQLIIPHWGYGSPASQDAFSYQLGWVHLISLSLAIFFWIRNKNKLFTFTLLCFLVSILLMLPPSLFFWQKLPLFKEIDFPWRLLGPTSFFLSLLIGFLTINKVGRYLSLVLATLVVLVNLAYAKPIDSINRPDIYYLTNEATTTSADELMPIWVKQKPTARPTEKAVVISGQAKIGMPIINAKKIEFQVSSQTDSEIQINTIYYPGWRVIIDKQPVLINYDNDFGLIRFMVPTGQHQVVANFGETNLRLFADAVFLAAIVITGGLLIKARKKSEV